jgi:hypothetical protein
MQFLFCYIEDTWMAFYRPSDIVILMIEHSIYTSDENHLNCPEAEVDNVQ